MYTLRLCKNNNQHIYKFIWQVYKHYLNFLESLKSENLSTLKNQNIYFLKNVKYREEGISMAILRIT